MEAYPNGIKKPIRFVKCEHMKKLLEKLRLYLKIQKAFLIDTKFLHVHKIDQSLWKRKFLNLLKSNDRRTEEYRRTEELLNEFIKCDIRKISHNKIIRKNKYAPILICVLKDEINKIESFLNHYRKIGVEVFIFLDNNSTDGTGEYLCRQKDAIVYSTKQQFGSVRKVAWINMLLAIYGNNRWCLVVDSDELVDYIGSEKYDLSDVIKQAEVNNYTRVEGFMLDMYSKNGLFDEKLKGDYVTRCRFFDKKSYTLSVDERGLLIHGGPRTRVFRKRTLLAKHPLFLFTEQDFYASSHYMIPFTNFKNCPVWLAIRHYKFVDDIDRQKVYNAVKTEIYADNSANYKQYLKVLEENEDVCFWNKNQSVELIDSYSLKEISFLKTFMREI
ncbi:MAG: glycosyltransferase family 2 protein [Lachnospiraceae bacterium]|nr:glycosyltransferase family 2 protein [Lachnospiraceae bacterium]